MFPALVFPSTLLILRFSPSSLGTSLWSLLKRHHAKRPPWALYPNWSPHPTMVFPVVMYGCWELNHKDGWALNNWYFWTVVLEKTFKSPLDRKEIKPANPKGNQLSILIGRMNAEAEAPILWPPDANSQLFGKDPDAGKDWGQEEKVTEDEMVGWHYRLNGHDFNKLWEIVKDGEVWCAAVHGVTKRRTQLSD